VSFLLSVISLGGAVDVLWCQAGVFIDMKMKLILNIHIIGLLVGFCYGYPAFSSNSTTRNELSVSQNVGSYRRYTYKVHNFQQPVGDLLELFLISIEISISSHGEMFLYC